MNTGQIEALKDGVTEETKERLSTLLKRIRGDETFRQFAPKIGTTHSTLNSWEQGVNFPKTGNLLAIAAYTNQSLEDLMHYLKTGESSLTKKTSSEKSEEAILNELNLLKEQEIKEIVIAVINKYLTVESIVEIIKISADKLKEIFDKP